jgi:transposase InsO family protein
MLTVIDEYTRERLAIMAARRLASDDVVQALADLLIKHGPFHHIRSDNGGEFTVRVVRAWLGRTGLRTLFIERGSLRENGCNESFKGKLRDELLDREIFYSPPGSQGADRAIAPPLQHLAASQLAGIPAARTRSDLAATHRARRRCPPARPAGRTGTWANFLVTYEFPSGGRPLGAAGLHRHSCGGGFIGDSGFHKGHRSDDSRLAVLLPGASVSMTNSLRDRVWRSLE